MAERYLTKRTLDTSSHDDINNAVSAEVRRLMKERKMTSRALARSAWWDYVLTCRRVRGATVWTLPELAVVCEILGVKTHALIYHATKKKYAGRAINDYNQYTPPPEYNQDTASYPNLDRLWEPICCPHCGALGTEQHPRDPQVVRCANCKEHLPGRKLPDAPR